MYNPSPDAQKHRTEIQQSLGIDLLVACTQLVVLAKPLMESAIAGKPCNEIHVTKFRAMLQRADCLFECLCVEWREAAREKYEGRYVWFLVRHRDDDSSGGI